MPEQLSPLGIALLAGGLWAVAQIFLIPKIFDHPRYGFFNRGGVAPALIGSYLGYEVLVRTVSAPTPWMFVVAGLAGSQLGISFFRAKTARNPEIVRVHMNKIDSLDVAAKNEKKKKKREPPFAEPYIARPVKDGKVIWNFTMKVSGNVKVPDGVDLRNDALYAAVHFNGRRKFLGVPIPGTKFRPFGDSVELAFEPFGAVKQIQDPMQVTPALIDVRETQIELYPVTKVGAGEYSLELRKQLEGGEFEVIQGMDPGMDIPHI